LDLGAGFPECVLSDNAGKFAFGSELSPKLSLLASARGYLPRVHARRATAQMQELIVLDPGGSVVSGHVEDAGGGPLVQARVMARALDADGTLAFAVSDGDGSFSLQLPEGDAELSAETEGYARVTRQIRAPRSGLVLTLAPGSSIRGRVIADTGLPLADVLVTANNVNGSLAAPRSVSTTEDGRFVLTSLQPGGYELSASAQEWRTEQAMLVTLGLGQTVDELILTVRRAANVAGTVHVDGKPCEDGRFELQGAVWLLTSISKGEVSIGGVLPGTYRVTIRCAQAMPHSEFLEVGSEPIRRAWQLKGGITLSGVVLTRTGARVPSASIRISPLSASSEQSVVFCNADANGEFTCGGLAAGEYECSVEGASQPHSTAVRVQLDDRPPAKLELRTDPAGTIRVHMTGESAGFGALTIVAERAGEPPILGMRRHTEFVFEGLVLGSYLVHSESYPEAAERAELVADGQVLELQLRSPPLLGIAGAVLDDTGMPVPDAWVRASAAEGQLGAIVASCPPTLSDAQGRFALDSLPSGVYDVHATTATGEAESRNVRAGGAPVQLRVTSYGSLSGTVTDTRGAPVPIFVVDYRRQDEDAARQLVGANGKWSAPWLAPGKYRLLVTSEAGSATDSVEVAPGARGSVSSRLTAADAPVSHVELGSPLVLGILLALGALGSSACSSKRASPSGSSGAGTSQVASSASAAASASASSTPSPGRSAYLAPYPHAEWRLVNPDQLNNVVLWVSHILIRHNESRNEDVAFVLSDWHAVLPAPARSRGEALALAEEIARRAQENPRSFAELAREHSEDITSKERGGSLGGLTAYQFSIWPQVLDALAALPAGTSSKVVETRYGFHVFHRAPPPPRMTLTGARIVIGYDSAQWLRVVGRGALPSRTREEARTLARRIYEQAKQQPSNFDALVARHSEHIDAIEGGDIGTWSTLEPCDLPRELEVLRGLTVGEIAPPLDTLFGYEVIRRVPERPRKEYAAQMIRLEFKPEAAEGDPSSRTAIGARAKSVADLLAKEPSRFGEQQQEVCCASDQQWQEGRGFPAIMHAVRPLTPGQIAREPVAADVAYYVVKRSQPVPIARSSPQFELPRPSKPDVDYVVGNLSQRGAQCFERIAEATRVAFLLSGATWQEVRAAHSVRNRFEDASEPEARVAAYRGLLARMRQLLGQAQYPRYVELVEKELRSTLLE
jgi:hypothetical protein